MRKQELVQLHALCSQVRDYLERRHDVPDAAFDRYDRTDVTPTSVHRKKGAHEEALDRLLSDLSSALATHVEESAEPVPTGTEPSHEEDSDRRPTREGLVYNRD